MTDSNVSKTRQKTVLSVGSGPNNPLNLYHGFRNDNWRQLRLDIDPAVKPDIIGNLTNMSAVKDASVDAVWSSHNLEHLYAHEVPAALAEFYRVVKDDGLAVVTLPDIQAVAQAVADGNLEDPLYESPAGPISAIDILWGLRRAIERGNHFMAHKTGFTADTLGQKLQQAGFKHVRVERENLNLWAVAYKTRIVPIN